MISMISLGSRVLSSQKLKKIQFLHQYLILSCNNFSSIRTLCMGKTMVVRDIQFREFLNHHHPQLWGISIIFRKLTNIHIQYNKIWKNFSKFNRIRHLSHSLYRWWRISSELTDCKYKMIQIQPQSLSPWFKRTLTSIQICPTTCQLQVILLSI